MKGREVTNSNVYTGWTPEEFAFSQDLVVFSFIYWPPSAIAVIELSSSETRLIRVHFTNYYLFYTILHITVQSHSSILDSVSFPPRHRRRLLLQAQ